jgi:integrase
VKKVRYKSDGFHTWSEEEIAAFEDKHPIGSRPRLALALLIYTGQRRSDLVNMGPKHVRKGYMTVRQQKTGKLLDLPMHPELVRVIAATTIGLKSFLVTSHGQPYTPAGFGNWFREQCNEAGLAQCSAHGLRKAACRRLAEAGCSANEIMAVSGHSDLREVTIYTAAAEQKRLATQAMASIGSGTGTGVG